MEHFLENQVFGLSGLVNLSNIVFIVAFSVKDVLWLRILAVISYCLVLPYYYFQSVPLWAPLFWGVAFIIVNGVRIVILARERRPVVLNEKEEELYRLAFTSVDKRDFLRLAHIAQWVDSAAGEIVLKKGQPVPEAFILISGEIEAVAEGKSLFAFRPGQIIGNASAFAGLVNPVDVVTRGVVRLAKWDLNQLQTFTEARPDLRAKLLQMGSADLAAKLRELGAIYLKSSPL